MGRMPNEPSAPATRTVYEPSQWDALTAEPGALPRLRAWLTANGISPSVVPTLTPIAVEERPDGTRVIRHHVYRTDHLGQKMCDPQRPGYAATAECAVPLAVDWQGPLLPAEETSPQGSQQAPGDMPAASADRPADAPHDPTEDDARPTFRGGTSRMVIPVQPYHDFAPAPDTAGAGHGGEA